MPQNEFLTSKGEPRGYIDFITLKQLWINTGSVCNLNCPNCFEESGPKSKRIQTITLDEIRPYLLAAQEKKVSSFGFTGGEPFMNPQFMNILEAALAIAPCLVLTNGTKPLKHYLPKLAQFSDTQKQNLTFRISINSPDEKTHDAQRGEGSFITAWTQLKALNQLGFPIAIARQMQKDEDTEQIQTAFQKLLTQYELPKNTTIVAFPDLAKTQTPEISETCISTYHTPQSCANFMCATTRMLVKKNDHVSLYACTLVDDDDFFNFGQNFDHALTQRTFLKHQRCFACFSSGVSCGAA